MKKYVILAIIAIVMNLIAGAVNSLILAGGLIFGSWIILGILGLIGINKNKKDTWIEDKVKEQL
jgi:hypothetical protein